MSFWEPTLANTLYTIALFLMGAVVLAPLAGWATTDDMNESSEDLTTSEWSIDQ